MSDLVANIRHRFVPLVEQAEAALQSREAQYPARVAAGKMTPEIAETEIRTWRAITLDWRNIVDGTGPLGDEATRSEKIGALEESIRRYNGALAKAIRSAPAAVQRDCTEGQPLWLLADRHGDAVEPVLDIHRQRQRIEELRDWYRMELPGAGDLFAGIHDYLEFHRQLRAANQQGRAAA